MIKPLKNGSLTYEQKRIETGLKHEKNCQEILKNFLGNNYKIEKPYFKNFYSIALKKLFPNRLLKNKKSNFDYYFKNEFFKNVTGSSIPDLLVTNKKNNKKILFECKKEGLKGNCSIERASFYLLPGISQAYKENLKINYFPICFIFSGEMLNNPVKLIKIELGFNHIIKNVCLMKTEKDLINFAKNRIIKILE